MTDPVLPLEDAHLTLGLFDEERRAAVRHQVTRRATCHTALAMGDRSWQAEVRDLSALGIGLVVRRQLEPSTLLAIDLENADRSLVRTVLARVVHVTENPDGGWTAGCAFTSELTDEELEAFQAERQRPAEQDCRAWVRFPCNVETVCYTLTMAAVEHVPARILDVSPGGLGLLVPCQFESGTLLNLALPGDGPGRKVLVRVVHVRGQKLGDWFLGCEFADQLSDEELEAFL